MHTRVSIYKTTSLSSKIHHHQYHLIVECSFANIQNGVSTHSIKLAVDVLCLQRNVAATVSLLTPENSQLTSDSQEVGSFTV